MGKRISSFFRQDEKDSIELVLELRHERGERSNHGMGC